MIREQMIKVLMTHKQAMELAIDALRREIAVLRNHEPEQLHTDEIVEREQAIEKLKTKIRTSGN